MCVCVCLCAHLCVCAGSDHNMQEEVGGRGCVCVGSEHKRQETSVETVGSTGLAVFKGNSLQLTEHMADPGTSHTWVQPCPPLSSQHTLCLSER